MLLVLDVALSVLVVLVAAAAFLHLFTGGWLEEIAAGRLYDTVLLNGALLVVELGCVGALPVAWIIRGKWGRVLIVTAASVQVLLSVCAGLFFVVLLSALGDGPLF